MKDTWAEKYFRERANNDFLVAQRDYLLEKLGAIDSKYLSLVAANEVLRTYNARMADEIDRLYPVKDRLAVQAELSMLCLYDGYISYKNREKAQEDRERAKVKFAESMASITEANYLKREIKELERLSKGTAKRENIEPAQRRIILERDGFRCRYCGKPIDERASHIDHVYPVSHGGKTVNANLVSSCIGCNLAKGDQIGIWPNQIASLRNSK